MSPRAILTSLCAVSLSAAVAAPARGQPSSAGPPGKQPDEVIVIDEKPPRPAIEAKATNFSPRKTPPYSDEAIERDAWTRAWLLLDIDARGTVTRFKFLKRPGYDLDEIAAREVFRLRFDPARDARGRPQRTWMVWGIEWPSHGWLTTLVGVASGMPPIVGFPPRSMAAGVPCRGSGPLHLDSLHPVYRDCSEPDLGRQHFERLPWIRPARRAARTR